MVCCFIASGFRVENLNNCASGIPLMIANKPRAVEKCGVKQRSKNIPFFDNESKKSLREALQYIQKDSEQNAEKVKSKILTSIKELLTNPKRYNTDKYKLNNDGSYRAYEIYKYRITYHVSDDEIRIIRIRHTKMNPLEY